MFSFSESQEVSASSGPTSDFSYDFTESDVWWVYPLEPQKSFVGWTYSLSGLHFTAGVPFPRPVKRQTEFRPDWSLSGTTSSANTDYDPRGVRRVR